MHVSRVGLFGGVVLLARVHEIARVAVEVAEPRAKIGEATGKVRPPSGIARWLRVHDARFGVRLPEVGVHVGDLAACERIDLHWARVTELAHLGVDFARGVVLARDRCRSPPRLRSASV